MNNTDKRDAGQDGASASGVARTVRVMDGAKRGGQCVLNIDADHEAMIVAYETAADDLSTYFSAIKRNRIED